MLIQTLLLQLFTKAWTAGILNGLGDAVSQKFVEKNDDFNFKRLGIFTLLVRDPFANQCAHHRYRLLADILHVCHFYVWKLLHS